MISNPPPEPEIGISNLLMWPGEEGPPLPKKELRKGVVETLMVRGLGLASSHVFSSTNRAYFFRMIMLLAGTSFQQLVWLVVLV